MSATILIIRIRTAIAALLIATLLAPLAACGTPAVAAAPAHLHGPTFASLSNAATLERGSSASAETAVDSLARALSRQQGYRPSSFAVELYSVPAESESQIEANLAATIAYERWVPAPELATTGSALRAIGWTRDRQAIVAGYGKDAASGRIFVAVLRAAR